MLVLTRHVGEEIVIDNNIRLTVLEARGRLVRLGITAPQSMRVLRKEVIDRQARPEGAAVDRKENSDLPNDTRIMEGLMRVAR